MFRKIIKKILKEEFVSNTKIFGAGEEFWLIPEWVDLILIPKK